MAQIKRIGRRVENCIFCPAEADSDEHAWSKWMLTTFPAPKAGIFADVGADRYENPTQKAIRLRAVCQKCNNEWMSRLEEAARPTLATLAGDIAMPLSTEDQTVVSQWALMKAMVWEYFSAERHRIYYLDGHREQMKDSRTMPENTTVWLGRWAGRSVLQSVARDAIDDLERQWADTTFRGWITEVIFGRLAVQVVSQRSLMNDNRRVTLEPVEDRRLCAVQVWPATSGVARWPPKQSIDQDISLTDFQRRWTGTTLMPW